MGDDSLNYRRLRSRKIRILPDPRLEERRSKERDDDQDRDEISESDDDSRDKESDGEKHEGYDEKKKVDDEDEDEDEDGSDGSDGSKKYYDIAKQGLEEMKNDSSFGTPFGDKRPTSNVDEKKSSSFGIFIMIAIGAILSFLIYFIYFSSGTKNTVDHHRERLSRWEKSFDDLVTKYGTALPEISRKVIDKSVRNVLQRRTPSEKFNQLEPAIILLLGSMYNQQAVKCIYQKLSKSVSAAYNEDQAPVIDVINFSKLELGEKFHDTFSAKSKGLHCIVVDGIERLDGNTALSLHTFTDHDKAPYLDTIIFLTAYTDNRLTNTSLQIQQIDKIANNILEVSWSKNLPIEQVSGLLSRITPSVAIISGTNSSQNWLCE